MKKELQKIKGKITINNTIFCEFFWNNINY